MIPRLLSFDQYVAARNGLIEIAESGAPLGVQSDSGNSRRAIIGYGYDLIANRNALVAVLSPLLAAGSTITAQNLSALEAFRAGALDQKQFVNAWVNVRLASVESARALLNIAAGDVSNPSPGTAEHYLNLKLGLQTALPPSKERAALASLAYNRGQAGVELIGPKLIGAIRTGDRAEAWYQIRYQSNGGGGLAGIAVRRFRESNLFGLYDSENGTTLEESLSVQRMYTRSRVEIAAYESRWLASSQAQLGQEAAPISNATAIARAFLTDAYVTSQSWIQNKPVIGGEVLVAELSSLAIVGSTRGSNLAGREPGPLANSGNDLLIGGVGNDTLLGLGGSNVLIGNGGRDFLLGGGGNDFFWGGPGDDDIFGGGGFDTVYYRPGDGQDTVSIVSGRIVIDAPFSEARFGYGYKYTGISQFQFQGLLFDLPLSSDNLRISPSQGGQNITVEFQDSSFSWGQIEALALANSAMNFIDTNNQSVGGEGNDFIEAFGAAYGGQGDDFMRVYGLAYGGDGDDSFSLDGSVAYGEAGNDRFTLQGPGVAHGGVGDDTYANWNPLDGNQQIQELAGEGYDTVVLPSYWINGLTFVMPANVEQAEVSFSQAGSYSIIGNPASETVNLYAPGTPGFSFVFEGSDGDDALFVSANFDTKATVGFFGGIGNDLVDLRRFNAGTSFARGGAGDDTYAISVGLPIIELADEGVDSIILFDQASAYFLPDHFENLQGSGSLFGNVANNVIRGSNLSDSIDGGGGQDFLVGLGGNDTYVVDDGDDRIEELASGGMDWVFASATFALPIEVEKLSLTGSASLDGYGNDYDNVLIGNSGANSLFGLLGNDLLAGGGGADTLVGGDGDDIYEVDGATLVEELTGQVAGNDLVRASIDYVLPANVERLELVGSASISGTGNSSANALNGNAGANRLDGLVGADTMAGGAGNDTFVVDSAGDVILENSGEGIDEIELGYLNPYWEISSWYQPYTMASGVERLRVLPSVQGFVAVTGNALDNRIEGGNFSAATEYTRHTLSGGAGNDTLLGGGGRDLLEGGEGDDSLSGGAGNDTLRGEAGSDTYVVDFALASGVDRIEDSDTGVWAGSGLNDRLQILGAPLSDLVFHAINTFDLQISRLGVAASNRSVVVENWFQFNRLGQRDSIERIVVGSDTLEGADVLTRIQRPPASPVDDRLVGSSGADSLNGGNGNDTLHGMEGNDVLVSGTGVNRLFGGPGNDSLDASANSAGGYMGGAYLDGGTGADTMRGGLGSDTYVVDDPGDVVIEMANGGSNDLLEIWTPTYELSANVESAVQNVSVPGTSWVIGNAGANYFHVQGGALIQAAGGDDTVSGASMIAQGGAGRDTLSGGLQSLLDGGSGGDVLDDGYDFVGTRASLFIGGADQDTLLGGLWSWDMENEMYWEDSGSDVIVFKEGDGVDSLILTPTGNQTLSISGFRLDEISLARVGNKSVNYPYGSFTTFGDLELQLGTSASDRITLQFSGSDWGHESLARLQVFIEDEEYSGSGSDPLRNERVQWFDFRGIADRVGSTVGSVLSGQQMAQALLDFHTGGSEDSAFGGDIAAYYHRTGSLQGMGRTFAHQVLDPSGLGVAAQPLRQISDLQTGGLA